MRNNTKGRKKAGAVLCAAVMIIFLVWILLSAILMPTGELILAGVLITLLIAAVAIVLYQRIREIESGEEDDAQKY